MAKVVVKRPAKMFSTAAKKDLVDRISIYCTALAGVENNRMVTAASGTLVTVNGRGCVLTAHHVIYGFGTAPKRRKGILDFELIGLFGNRGWTQETFRRELFVDVPIAPPHSRSGEPDLAALILPDGVMDDFNAWSKAFYNLDTRKAADVKRVAMDERGEMIVTGAPWSANVYQSQGVESHFYLGHVMTTEHRRRKGFDYVKVGVGYDAPATPPKDFSGVSGGGAWVVPTTENDEGTVDLSGPPLLAGVVFRQVVRHGVVKSIRCHGPHSVYDVARAAISKALQQKKIWTGHSGLLNVTDRRAEQ